MKKVRVADWDALEPLQPSYALVANVDLVVIRRQDEDRASVLYGRCLHRGALMSDGFPERLKKLRQQKNLLQSDLAKRVGVHQNHIGRYERGSSRPSGDALKRLADALGVSIDYLRMNV